MEMCYMVEVLLIEVNSDVLHIVGFFDGGVHGKLLLGVGAAK
jgi:hypothetical protein